MLKMNLALDELKLRSNSSGFPPPLNDFTLKSDDGKIGKIAAFGLG